MTIRHRLMFVSSLLGAALPALAQTADPPVPDASAIAELAKGFQEQAQQTAAVAEQVRNAPPADAAEILRTAELNGVSTAWFARRAISDAPAGTASNEIVTEAEQASVVELLHKQSESLRTFAEQIAGAASADPAVTLRNLESIQAPDAALVAAGAATAPDPAAEAAVALDEGPNAAQLLILGADGLSFDFPSVGAIVIRQPNPRVRCTGTLVSPSVVVTAAHCVRAPHGGIPDAVFFQHAGTFPVREYRVHPGYLVLQPSGQPVNDLAVLQLERPVPNIRPAPVLEPGAFTPGSLGRIVGFGARNLLSEQGVPLVGSSIEFRTGLKLAGMIETRSCSGLPRLEVTDPRICWELKGLQREATVCSGDSGGPLFVERTGEWYLAGVTSFGYPASRANPCPPTGFAVDVDLTGHHGWLNSEIALLDPDAPGAPPVALSPVLNDPARYAVTNFERINRLPSTSYIRLGSGVSLLTVSSNATDVSARMRLTVTDPQGTERCEDNDQPPLLYCQVESPGEGTWRIQVEGIATQELQVTAFIS